MKHTTFSELIFYLCPPENFLGFGVESPPLIVGLKGGIPGGGGLWARGGAKPPPLQARGGLRLPSPPLVAPLTIGMLELMWVFTTVERVNFTPNWLRTILFVYDFWHFSGRAECTLYTPPSPLPQAQNSSLISWISSWIVGVYDIFDGEVYAIVFYTVNIWKA